jgi:hypothetical protein
VELEALKTAVLLACRAPSVHNSQPWRWVARDDVVHLFVDTHRTVSATDHSGREAILSCGAALDHFRFATTAAGWLPGITRLPNPIDLHHLASIEFSPLDHVTQVHRQRAQAILRRRTDRLAFGMPTYWDRFEPVLRSALVESVATLDVLDDDQRPRLVQVSELSESPRREDSSYQLELQWWTSPFALVDGIPPAALASDVERRRVDVGRHFPVRSHQDRRPEIGADWSKILVLSTRGDTLADVLGCGEALSTVLLECTMAGLATCTLTHLIESRESRDIVRDLVGGGEPQVLIRVGMAPPLEAIPAPTPRRPLDGVLEIH